MDYASVMMLLALAIGSILILAIHLALHSIRDTPELAERRRIERDKRLAAGMGFWRLVWIVVFGGLIAGGIGDILYQIVRWSICSDDKLVYDLIRNAMASAHEGERVSHGSEGPWRELLAPMTPPNEPPPNTPKIRSTFRPALIMPSSVPISL